MNPQLDTGLATNTQLAHPASKFSTYRPTNSMCWLLWPWFNQTRNTACNHLRLLTRLERLHHQWFWVQLKAGKHRRQLQMKTLFTQRTNLNESIGIFCPNSLPTLLPKLYPRPILKNARPDPSFARKISTFCVLRDTLISIQFSLWLCLSWMRMFMALAISVMEE